MSTYESDTKFWYRKNSIGKFDIYQGEFHPRLIKTVSVEHSTKELEGAYEYCEAENWNQRNQEA